MSRSVMQSLRNCLNIKSHFNVAYYSSAGNSVRMCTFVWKVTVCACVDSCGRTTQLPGFVTGLFLLLHKICSALTWDVQHKDMSVIRVSFQVTLLTQAYTQRLADPTSALPAQHAAGSNLLPETQCYVARGHIWNKRTPLTLSLAKRTHKAEKILKTSELFLYGEYTATLLTDLVQCAKNSDTIA